MERRLSGANDSIDHTASTIEERYCCDGYDSLCVGTDSPGQRGTTGRLSRVSDKVSSVQMSYDSLGRQTSESRAATGGSLVTTTQFDANKTPRP